MIKSDRDFLLDTEVGLFKGIDPDQVTITIPSCKNERIISTGVEAQSERRDRYGGGSVD